jgi:dCMP deaminase
LAEVHRLALSWLANAIHIGGGGNHGIPQEGGGDGHRGLAGREAASDIAALAKSSLAGAGFLVEMPMAERASWDEYFMNIASVVASRSTCPRKFVGAVIVREKTILSTGYNGSIRGMPHCSEVGHMMENDHCVATIHAESNAILQAAKNGVMIDGGTLYVTASPCWSCFKQIANSGLRRIVFGEFYRDDRIFQVAQTLAIELVHLQSVPVSQPNKKPQDG